MVDTIGFNIPITKEDQLKIMRMGTGTQRKDFKNNYIEFFYANTETFIGSYEHKVQLRATSENLRIEFSIPKIINGHNITLIDDKDILQGVKIVRNSIINTFKVKLPPIDEWNIYRIDLCYAWKYPNNELTKKALKFIKTLEYLNFKKHTYKTAYMLSGTNYSMKFYLKQPEFIKHDLRNIRNTKHIKRIEPLLYLSDNVLRFEITLRKKQLVEMYGKHLHLPFFIKLDKISVLQQYISKMIKTWNSFQKEEEVIEKLNKKYSKTKSIQLFLFYKGYYDEKVRPRIKDSYNQTTIWRNVKQLKDADVGIPTEEEEEKLFHIDLNIPSNYSINNFQ